MRVFKTKEFDKFARKERLTDKQLRKAVAELEDGLFDADLGSHLFKKRIAHGNHGKSGAYRSLLAFKAGETVFFLYGFAKNEKDNISPQEKQALKILSKQYLQLTDHELEHAKHTRAIVEIEAQNNE